MVLTREGRKMKVNICDICDKIIGHKQGVTLKASDHTLTRIIDNHVISSMKRKYKVHICDDCIEAIEDIAKRQKPSAMQKKYRRKLRDIRSKSKIDCKYEEVAKCGKYYSEEKAPKQINGCYGGFHIWEKRQTCVLGDDKLKDDEISYVITVNSFADWNMPRDNESS